MAEEKLNGSRPPWLSEKVWLAGIGLVALTVLGVCGVIELSGIDIVGLFGALILGRAWEGAAAAKGKG